MRIIDKISPKRLGALYWHQKMSSTEIAKVYNCDPGYIRDLLRKYRTQTRTLSEAIRLRFGINIPKGELKRLYIEKKLSSPEIARIYKHNHATVRSRLREYGIKIRTLSEANKIRYNINISEKELKKLYSEREISSPEIAKIYHCAPGTIRNLLKKYGIRVRTKSEARRLFYDINISKKELKKLYLEKKISSPEIAKRFKCSPALIRDRLKEYKISIRSLQEALPLSNKPRYPQKDFNGNLEEKAYLIGFRLGDLHAKASSKNSSSIYINVASTKPELIKIVEQSFSPYGHVWQSEPDKIGIVYIRTSLNRTFNFLLPKKDLIEPWILRNKKYFAAFLAGYTDAEGTFCLCGGDAVFSIRSQDKNILHQIQNKLTEQRIFLRPPQIARRKGTRDIRGTISNENIWAIFMHRKDAILKLIDLINPYLKHADKRKRMKMVKNNIIWRNKKYNRHQTSKWDKLYLKDNINYVGAFAR